MTIERLYYGNNRVFLVLWYLNNKNRINKQKTEYRNNNSKIKINESISAGIYYALKQNKSCCHWENLVNFSFNSHNDKDFKICWSLKI